MVFVYQGRVFLKGGWDEIRSRQPGMMLLISLAISVAFVSSVANELGLLELAFRWELAALVTVMLLGHWQEMRALGITRGALAATRTVPASELRAGRVLLVRPASRVPADGTMGAGQADFDASMFTGESRPARLPLGRGCARASTRLARRPPFGHPAPVGTGATVALTRAGDH